MFTPAPELRRVHASADRVVAIIESINTPNVVIPGCDAEPTQAFIVGVRNPDATFSVMIYLYQTQSFRPAIYVSSPRAVPLAQYPEVEAEAIGFVESMGFMVDNLNFRRLTPVQQADVMERLPVFQEDPGARARAALDAEGSGKPVPATLEGLDGLDDAAPLQELQPLDELDDLDSLPVVGAQLRGGPLGALDAAVDNALGMGSAPTLSDEDRARLSRLLGAF